jgi:SAM-dependent methyltransferase
MDVPHSRKNAILFIQHYLEITDVKNKTVIDLSAGAGYMAGFWKTKGAKVTAFDLYPELMKDKEIPTNKIDLNKPFPIENGLADFVVLTETIDHISEQQQLFAEISRILKPNGIFILTKPNNSNISGRMANLWLESERADMFLPNEKTVIGYDNDKVYMGRIFLIGVQKIRTLAGLSGLKIQEICKNQISISSLLYFLLIGWYFAFRTFLTYTKLSKNTEIHDKNTLFEQYKLNQNPVILFHKHLCLVFKKV